MDLSVRESCRERKGEAMNRPSKLGRKNSSEESLIKKPESKKKSSPRNPLKELNTCSVPPPLASAEAPRKGCFSFLISNSSSKDSLPRSKSQPRTPKSAPPNSTTLPSRNPTNTSKSRDYRNVRQIPSIPSSETPKKVRPEKPKTPDLLIQKWNRRKPRKASEGKNGDSVRGIQSGSCLASTPEKTLPGISPEMGSEAVEGNEQLSTTPNSTTTPPIHSSISPEIPCGSSVAPPPVCFAAGHVLAGVHDRRKCRPRGILTVGGSGSEVKEISALGFPNGCSDPARISFAPPPIAEASIHWLSPPSDNANGCRWSGSSGCMARLSNCHDEASVNWLFSPSGDVEGSDFRSGLGVENAAALGIMRDKSVHSFWRFSPGDFSTTEMLGLNSPISDTTPSSGHGIWRTPTTDSSISPFSAILQRAAASPVFKPHRTPQETGRYRYGSAKEDSPFSQESQSNGCAISMTSSYSNSRKTGMLSRFEVDSMADVLQSMKLSPRAVHPNDSHDLSPLPALSFQFDCPATPLNSIDLTCFQKPSCDEISAGKEFCLKDKGSSTSEVRISWRDGLVSRIFEMGELDCCQWLSDDEDIVNCLAEDSIESEFSFKFGSNNRSSILKEGNDQQIAGSFGSFEFPGNEIGVQKCEAKVPPQGLISGAESLSTEGGGLISSGDSDWTLFYKNHLFEV